jgi:hypothetical protein
VNSAEGSASMASGPELNRIHEGANSLRIRGAGDVIARGWCRGRNPGGPMN